MSSDDSKPALKIFCSKCDQKMDVSEFKCFATFPCPVCKTDITVPKRFGEYVLTKKLEEDKDFENYSGLKDKKAVAVKIFKKKIVGDLCIKASLGMLSKELPGFKFSEIDGQICGISENLEALKVETAKKEPDEQKKEKAKKDKKSAKKEKAKPKKKSPGKTKVPTLKAKTESPKAEAFKVPAKAVKLKTKPGANNSTAITLGALAAIIILAFLFIPKSSNSAQPKNPEVSISSDKKNDEKTKVQNEEKAVSEETAGKEEERKKEIEAAEAEKAKKEAEETARKEEERKKEAARIKEEQKKKDLAEFLALIKPSEEQKKKFAVLPPVSNTHLQELMNKSCIDCHNAKKRKGDLDATMFTTAASIYISFERIKDIYSSVKSGDMPPEDEDFPESDKEHLLSYLEKIIFTLESKPPSVPSTAMVRRLTPYEYDYTVQDITGLDLEFADSFPAESSGGQGFVNDAQQLNVSPILMEKYMEAAEKIADFSEFDIIKGFSFSKKPSPLQRPEQYEEELRRQVYSYLKDFYPKNFSVQAFLPKLIQACAEIQETNKSPEETASKHGLHPLFVQNGLNYFSSLSGKSKTESAILRNWSKLRSAKDDTKVLSEISQQLSTAYSSAVTVLNNRQNKARFEQLGLVYNIESIFTLDKEAAAQYLDEKKIQNYAKVFDLYQFSRFASSVRQGAAVQVHLKPLINDFLSKMYRRPPGEKELNIRVNDVLNDSINLGFPQAVRILVIREFCSFNFFFRIESKRESKIDDYDLASRLSYFLWAGPPDEELLKLAGDKKLAGTEELNKQIDRMLKDKRSARLAKHFAEQWLKLDQILKSSGPEKEIFPGFDKELGKDMWMETAMCFNYIVKNDRSMLELLSSDYTIINNRLSRIYGLNQNSPQFKKVYVKNAQRGGITGHASILTMTSLGKRTSPIIRGSWVLSTLLGTPTPPPPMDVEELPEGEAVTKNFTLKEQLAHHRDNPSCKSCHKKIDPLGFVMENYDTVGRWREEYINRSKVDTQTQIDGEAISGPAGLKKYLMDNKTLYIKNLSKKLLSYALGRDIHFYDNFTVNKMIENAMRDDYSFSSLVKTIVSSPQFQHK